MVAHISDIKPSLLSRFMRRALVWIYRLYGWKAVGRNPKSRRFVLVAAPHTSNWDFLFFIGLTDDIGIRPYFMAKESLFKWPFRNFLLQMGGVPVERRSSQNYVEQMIHEFKTRDDFILTVAPEGTRGNVKQWRTGFYHIAMGAGVPLVIGFMDYGKKTGGLGPEIMPTGDYEADMAKISSLYHSVTPKNPQLAMDNITEPKEIK